MVLFNKALPLFFFIVSAVSIEAASLFYTFNQKDQKTWVKLLHYENSEIEGKTLIDEPSFFVSSLGQKNPAAELDEFLKEIKSRTKKFGRLKLPIHCAYPARTLFLKKLKLIKRDLPPCNGFSLWKKEVNPIGISVVFSTAYPNNPASMFGHTFLRFHKKGKSSDLLDYGANYSAQTTGEDNGFMYAMKGIFGGYKGYFDLSPYYIKLNEYLYGENRDLIEYQLNLRQDQIDFILAHLWELYQGASFDYYFTEENCSFHLASLINVSLEAPLPSVDRWYYLPTDLIHQITKVPHLVKEIKDRPSRNRMIRKTYGNLQANEKKSVKTSLSEGTNKTQSIKEAKALVGILNYLKFKQKENFPQKEKKLLRQTLLDLSHLEMKKEKNGISKPFRNRPHLSHSPQRVSLGFGSQNSQTILNMGIRSGYHDLLGRDEGLEAFSQFRFLGFEGQFFEEDRKMRMKEIIILDIASLFPIQTFERQISWKVGGRFEDMPEYGSCANCWRFITEGKIGASLGNRKWLLSLLMGAVAEASPRYRRGHKESLAYEVLLGKTFSLGKERQLKILSSFEGYHNIRNLKKDIRSLSRLGLNYSWNRIWETRIKGELPLLGTSYSRIGERFEFQLAYYF